MITLSGKLTVRTANNRQGEFCKEAYLKCSLGRFRIRYVQLDSLSLGEYEGFFTMTKIEPFCHNHQGKFLLELEAVIEKMAFTSQPENLLNQENKPLIQRSLLSQTDMFDEEESHHIKVSVDTQQPSEILAPVNNDEEGFDEDEELFGDLFPLAEEVALDASRDRSILRRQINRLKEKGYTFDAKSQHWLSQDVPLSVN